MPARVITATPTADELPSGLGGLYNELEVPGDYEVRLVRVEDYDKGDGRQGWIFIYSCETPSGGSVEFRHFLSFSPASRWKIFETFDAHGSVSEEGTTRELNPNALIDGSMVAAFIDFPRDKTTGEATSQYRGIEKIFAIVEEPEGTATPEPVSLAAVAPESI